MKKLLIFLGFLAIIALADEPTNMTAFLDLFPYTNDTNPGPDYIINKTFPANNTWELHVYPTQEDGVLILNDTSFDWARSDFKYMIVNFWHSNCTTWCRAFEPYYFEAHEIIKNNASLSNVHFAQLDMQYNTVIQERLNITHHPQQILFLKKLPNQPIWYYGTKNCKDFVAWIEHMMDYLHSKGY